MKYKKYSYLIVIMIMLLVGVNNVHAKSSKTCYYIAGDNNFKAQLDISWGYPSGFWNTLDDYVNVSVDKVGDMAWTKDKEALVNWWAASINNWYDQCVKGGSVCFTPYYNSESAANNTSEPSCPKYLVFQSCATYYVWGTESQSIAEKAVAASKSNGCSANYASYKNKYGKPIDEEEYYSEFKAEGLVGFDKDKFDCSDYETIFGDKDDPESIRGMLEVILQYVRVIVPILIITLGTIDFAKAVIAAKEDNMKKAQTDFIKRVIMGVAVFFVPVLIDIIMDLAEIVWDGNYIHCGF